LRALTGRRCCRRDSVLKIFHDAKYASIVLRDRVNRPLLGFVRLSS